MALLVFSPVLTNRPCYCFSQYELEYYHNASWNIVIMWVGILSQCELEYCHNTSNYCHNASWNIVTMRVWISLIVPSKSKQVFFQYTYLIANETNYLLSVFASQLIALSSLSNFNVTFSATAFVHSTNNEYLTNTKYLTSSMQVFLTSTSCPHISSWANIRHFSISSGNDKYLTNMSLMFH